MIRSNNHECQNCQHTENLRGIRKELPGCQYCGSFDLKRLDIRGEIFYLNKERKDRTVAGVRVE